ncbi:thioredoxin family protein [Thermobrachium celere]|uniref:Thioredoxin n=1 Tax=Thermobrachium celere DSM 8682 TaxID=941824 RepID=R7RTW5_9CLOT|nr:thioredoxin family protein [Thermobrachium celere]CDF58700.1 conserved hypothetical protein [Thermobrachium celere DSM 8682]
MLELINALTVEEYLKTYDEEKLNKHRELAKEIYRSSLLNNLKKENLDFRILMFSESFCPDCLILFPFISFLNDQMGIDVKILKRQGNEELLKQLTGEARIPTVIFINKDDTLRGIIVEFPQEFKNLLINLSYEEMKDRINKYREGKYIKLIEEEIVRILMTK